MIADLFLNYFFMPPFGTFTIADPQNWVALFVFLAVSVVASYLSSALRDRAFEATARRDELARLFDLSRDVLLTTDSSEAMSQLARFVARRFDLEFVGDLPATRHGLGHVGEAGPIDSTLDASQLSRAFAGAERTLEFDAQARAYSGHQTDRGRGPPGAIWCRCGSGPRRSDCWPRPGGPSSPARSTRSPASSPSRSSARSFSRSGRPPSWRVRAKS